MKRIGISNLCNVSQSTKNNLQFTEGFIVFVSVAEPKLPFFV